MGGINAVNHDLNHPCQPSYSIMYQSFAMDAQADATRCITPPNISTALDFLKMRVEMIPDQECVTISPFYKMTAPLLTSLKLIKSGYFQYFCSLTLKWIWCDLGMTLVLCTSKAQLFPMLLFSHKLRSCWCLQTNLTLQNSLILFQPPSPGIQQWEYKCAQEFSVRIV